jgi:hypothetical protein
MRGKGRDGSGGADVGIDRAERAVGGDPSPFMTSTSMWCW